MNHKPVAWMNESDWMGGVEIDVITDEFKQSGKGGDCSEYHIPLYTHPVKELKNIVLASATCSCGKVMEVTNLQPVKELTDEEINQCWEDLMGTDDYTRIDIGRAILRKAQEK